MNRLTRDDAAAKGQWLIHMTCCGYDDGWWFAPTWDEADDFRESYNGTADHQRTAIIAESREAIQ